LPMVSYIILFQVTLARCSFSIFLTFCLLAKLELRFYDEVLRTRDRSWLRYMLPELIVDRLESGQTLIADHHDSVTVLVSNIIGFTELSQYCSTSALMLILNELFSAFDDVLDRHGRMRCNKITQICRNSSAISDM